MKELAINSLKIFGVSIILMFLITGNTSEDPIFSVSVVIVLLLSVVVSLLLKIVQSLNND